MKRHTLATLLCVLLVPALLGIGHCSAGDARVFTEDCLRTWGSEPKPRPPFAKLVSFSRTERRDLTYVEERLEVTNCHASFTRTVDGTVSEAFPTYEIADIEALHEALVDAGALDAQSAAVDLHGCPMGLSSEWSEVTVYEPGPLPGTAWSNSFSFGSCAHSEQTAAVEAVLNTWIGASFDPSRSASTGVVPVPDAATGVAP